METSFHGNVFPWSSRPNWRTQGSYCILVFWTQAMHLDPLFSIASPPARGLPLGLARIDGMTLVSWHQLETPKEVREFRRSLAIQCPDSSASKAHPEHWQYARRRHTLAPHSKTRMLTKLTILVCPMRGSRGLDGFVGSSAQAQHRLVTLPRAAKYWPCAQEQIQQPKASFRSRRSILRLQRLRNSENKGAGNWIFCCVVAGRPSNLENQWSRRLSRAFSNERLIQIEKRSRSRAWDLQALGH